MSYIRLHYQLILSSLFAHEIEMRVHLLTMIEVGQYKLDVFAYWTSWVEDQIQVRINQPFYLSDSKKNLICKGN